MQVLLTLIKWQTTTRPLVRPRLGVTVLRMGTRAAVHAETRVEAGPMAAVEDAGEGEGVGETKAEGIERDLGRRETRKVAVSRKTRKIWAVENISMFHFRCSRSAQLTKQVAQM